MEHDNGMTQAWKYYELGRAYNNSLVPNQYRTVNTNIEFFAGNQWLHIPDTPAMQRLPRPVFNIIKRVTSLFVASLTSSAVTVSFEPLSYYDGEQLDDPETNAAVYATAEVRNLFEKFKMDHRIREALFDAAQTGDYCAHFFWRPDALPYGGAFGEHRGEIEMELVDGINVMFGNPNSPEVEAQPYILIVGRDTVENLKREAEHYRSSRRGRTDGEIRADSETDGQSGIGGTVEIAGDDDRTGKALYVYLYTKAPGENGEYTVHVTKATRECNIFEDIDTGLTRYPIAWGNWEKQKNQYHGRALVTGIVPNQIFINSMMAMVFRHLQLQSFPKTVYNADLVPKWNNDVGVALGVHGLMPGQSLESVASVLQPADMSNQIVMAIDKVMAYTKECLGATDAQMGNVRPDNTSALMVLQNSSEIPLENPRQCLYEWVEDIAAILLDMMGTYYGSRPLVRERSFTVPVTDDEGRPVIDPISGRMQTRTVRRRVTEQFDFSVFKRLWLNVAVNAGATTYYSEIAMVQTLDNLRRDGTLEVIDYLERIPDKLIPRKAELIDEVRRREGIITQDPGSADVRRAGMPARLPGSPSMGGELSTGLRLSSMPESIQNKYDSLPKVAQNALMRSK